MAVTATLAGSGTAGAATAVPRSPAVQPDFSQANAAAWALANVNGTYNGFNSDDCTDFISRALLAAGYPFSYTASVLPTDSSNDAYWYIDTGKYGRHWSHSWSVAHDLAVHLIDMKSARVTLAKDAKPGDIVFVNWRGTAFSGIEHAGIITGMSGGIPLITQHSPTQKTVSLKYWVDDGGPNVHFWIYRPNP